MANYNLFDAASLAMVPTGIKDGKLYSVKPNDGAGDFTFSRGTDLTATRVNADGLIEKGRTNKLIQSNTFNTYWSFYQGQSAPVGGQSGYDGTNDAWSLVPNAAPDSHNISQAVTKSGVNTLSVYAKANGYDHILLYDSDLNAGNFFNVASGSVGSAYNGGGIDAQIESAGNGYYRCSFTFNATGGNTSHIFVCPSDGTFIFSGDTTSGVLVQDAQVEQGLVATDYIETTTAPVSAGITENLPRIDYSGGCGSLLLEPQRSNLMVHSEYFGAGDWVKAATSISSNATTSPEGVINAAKIVENSANTYHHINDTNVAVSSGQAYTLSVFAKADGRNFLRLLYDDGTTASNAYFNLLTGAVHANTNCTPSIESMGDDWYRCSITMTSGGTSTYIQFLLDTNGSGAIYQGDGTSGIYIYGAQLEAGSYPTSYIPTYGSAATRTGDGGTTNIDSLINESEGVLFLDYIVNDITSAYPVDFQLQYNGTNSVNGVTIFQQGSTPSVVVRSGSTQVFYAALASSLVGDRNKIALAYKKNDYVVYQNGVKVLESFSGNAPVALNEIRISDGTRNFNINQSLLFKSRLTNNELAALTRPYDTYQEWVDGEGLIWESKSCTVQNIVELQNL